MVWKKTMMYAIKDENFTYTFYSRLLEHSEDRHGWLHFNDPRKIFAYLYQHFNDKFPKHFIFANFQCIRCGECCNWDWRDIYREDIEKWISESRYDILRHIYCLKYHVNCRSRFLHYYFENPCENCRGGDLVPLPQGKCHFLRKVRKKPYYECRIHDSTPENCSGYLCEKSLPVAHLNWIDVEDLIQRVGLERYKTLAKRKVSQE